MSVGVAESPFVLRLTAGRPTLMPLAVVSVATVGSIIFWASRDEIASLTVLLGGPAVGGAFVGTLLIALWSSFLIAYLRVYYQLLFFWMAWPIPLPSLYRIHPVAWDDLCLVPFPGLDKFLIAYASWDVEGGKNEIDRLIASYPSQRTAALRARVVLLAREAGRVPDLTKIDAILARLPGGPKRFLIEAQQIRDLVGEISGIQAHLNTIDRAFSRNLYAQLLVTKIENFQARIGGFDIEIAREFRVASENWKQIALLQLRAAEAITAKEPVPEVFRAGDPIDRSQEAFIRRDAVAGALEQQIMLSTGCPGIILYGRRRVGKTTVLRNLDDFLPISVIPIWVSMQNPEMFTSLPAFVRNLARHVDGATKLSGEAEDLPGLYRLLGECNEHLKAEKRRLLLSIDEYEVIDRKIKDQVLPMELLDTLRESIQNHREITWLLAGSHRITELPNANWTSYLVSARTVEVGPFSEYETHLLLTEPFKYSSLEDSSRPRFPAGFWGDGGIERIHAEAGGWPVLVQLIAETAVSDANNEGAQVVRAGAMERALQQSVVKGDTVLSQLMRGESTLPGISRRLPPTRPTVSTGRRSCVSIPA